MSARDNSELSADESTLAPRDVVLRSQLEREQEDAERRAGWYEVTIKGLLSEGAPVPWEYIRDYADATAKLVLVRDRIDRFGLRRRIGDN